MTAGAGAPPSQIPDLLSDQLKDQLKDQLGPPPWRLGELPFPVAAAARAAAAVILVPVGATEAHGPHLPLCTDVFLSEELAARVQRALWQRGTLGLIAPALSYAVTEFGAPFAGTVSLDAESARALYGAVFAGLLRSGFARLCIVNSHLEAAHVQALRGAVDAVHARTGVRVAFPDQTERRWARTLSDEYKRGDCHAGSYETSLLLAARPELVRTEAQRGLPRNDSGFLGAVRAGAATFPAAGGPQAYFGDPAGATAAEGEDLYARLVQMVLVTLEETLGVPASR